MPHPKRRLAVLLLLLPALFVAVPAAPAAALTGPNQTYFYNGDVCASLGVGAVCKYNNGGMTYGTLSTGTTYPPSYSWRAGSGNGSKDRCAKSAGPMPMGNWNFVAHFDSKTGTIAGRAFQLQDMLCDRFNPYSTKRIEMFIHTEETSSRGQYCPTSARGRPILLGGCQRLLLRRLREADPLHRHRRLGLAMARGNKVRPVPRR